MLKYTLKRILYMIPVLVGISVLVFFILQLAPGDVTHLILGEDQSVEAVEQLREEVSTTPFRCSTCTICPSWCRVTLAPRT